MIRLTIFLGSSVTGSRTGRTGSSQIRWSVISPIAFSLTMSFGVYGVYFIATYLLVRV